MLHLVPQWQSSIRHERLKVVMADRPDLIQSELAGLAFDALQQCFRTADIDSLMNSEPQQFAWRQTIHIVIDPAAGGPHSDFAIVSFVKHKGIITVSLHCFEGLSSRASRALFLGSNVLYLDVMLKVVQTKGLVHQKFWDQIVSKHSQKASPLVRAHGLQSYAVILKHPKPKLGVKV
jgi:hypothetical protein